MVLHVLLTSLGYLTLFTFALVAILFLIALPATLSLPAGQRSGVEPMSVNDAASHLKHNYSNPEERIEAARLLVGTRMQYCRRNSFDSYSKAFSRGYGYCQQSAFALCTILNLAGIHSQVVNAVKNRFPNGRVSGHVWVKVNSGNRKQYIDPLYYDLEHNIVTFTPLSRVFPYSPAFRLLAGWGSAAVNAWRYYTRHSDVG